MYIISVYLKIYTCIYVYIYIYTYTFAHLLEIVTPLYEKEVAPMYSQHYGLLNKICIRQHHLSCIIDGILKGPALK